MLSFVDCISWRYPQKANKSTNKLTREFHALISA
jgi:hypothetical protein